MPHNHHNHKEHCSHHSHHSLDFNRKTSFKFIVVMFLNLFISVLEIIAGVLSSSVALIADAFHNLQDTASVFLSYLAWKISFKKPNKDKTFGYKRAEIIAAFINSVFLFAVCIFLFVESVKRFFAPEIINPDIMIWAAGGAFLANIVSVFMLSDESSHSINWKSAYLHMLGDALFSLAVMLGALAVKFWKFYWVDPALSLFMSVLIIFQTIKVFKKSLSILMQSSADLDYEEIRIRIEAIDGVKNIHHVHTWMSNENTVYFEAHIEVDEMSVSKTCDISKHIEKMLKEKYQVYHTTLQFETDRCGKKEIFCD